MATVLDAVLAGRQGTPLTQDERAAYSRFILGGGSGQERFFNPDGTLNLASQQGPGVTTGEFLARFLENPVRVDWARRFGAGPGFGHVAGATTTGPVATIGSGTTSNVLGQEFSLNPIVPGGAVDWRRPAVFIGLAALIGFALLRRRRK